MKHLEVNAENEIWNKIKDSLVQALTERILSEITELSNLDSIINKIVDHKETTFETKLIHKLSNKVIPQIITDSTAELQQNI